MKILHICPTFDSKTCGIGAYTRHLCGSIKNISPESTQEILNGFGTIYQALLEHKPDVAHIQLEYGFCSPQRLLLIDSYCEQLKIPLFVTFHSLGNSPHNNALKHAIKLSHTPLSKDYGVFTLIPSGIPKFSVLAPGQESYQVKVYGELNKKLLDVEKFFLQDCRKENTFLFFGQAHRHKQLLETILQFEGLRAAWLVCVVSKPVQGDQSYYEECKRLAKSFPNICWIENYLEDEEVLLISEFCSTALFPYVEYGSIGVSAAVKLLLNNLDLKIYTTFASHFSDIPDDLGIVSKFHTLEDMFEVDMPHDKKMREVWVDENNFNQVAKKHLALYQLSLDRKNFKKGLDQN